MTWLAQNNWVWLAVAAALGAIVTWILMVRRVAYVDTTIRRSATAPGFGTHVDAPSAPAAAPEPPAPPVVETPVVEEPEMAAPEITETFAEGPGASVPAVSRPAAGLSENVLGASLAGGAAAAAADEPEADVVEFDEPEVEEPEAPEVEDVAPAIVEPYGPGSAEPLADGSAPSDVFTIKGNADSMLYHTVESPYYGRTIAEVWFDTETAARDAGFTRWDQRVKAEPEPVAAPVVPPGPYGPGSAEPLAAGASPSAEFTIKGNADSMLYHTDESPYYGRTIAEVWFNSETVAREAGFTRWDERVKAEPAPAAAIPPGPYGEGSAEPLDGGASPGDAFTIKGNADSMLYHTEDSPYYGRTIAEVWFDSESAARAAGFTRWDQR